MIGLSKPLTALEAAAFQRKMFYEEGVLVIWCVTTNTKDFGSAYVARPILTPELVSHPVDGYLIAESLDELRKLLPLGLARLDRNPQDDPVIVETWF